MYEKYYDEHPDPHSCMQFIFNWNQTVPYSYLSKKKQNVYTVTLYTVYHRNSWQYMYSISMLLICKHLGIMENVWKIYSSLEGKKEYPVVTVHTLLKVEFF